MAFFDKDSTIIKGTTLLDFYMAESLKKRCSLQEVDKIVLRDTTISAKEMEMLANVHHLECHNCVIDTLTPLVGAKTKKLSLNHCTILQRETGSSFATLTHLRLFDAFDKENANDKNKRQIQITEPPTLSHLDLAIYDVTQAHMPIFSAVKDVLILRYGSRVDLHDLKCHTLVIPNTSGNLKMSTLSKSVRHLYAECNLLYSDPAPCEQIETFICPITMYGPFQLDRFPNVQELCVSNSETIPLGDKLPKLKKLTFADRGCFSPICRDGLEIHFEKSREARDSLLARYDF